MKVCAGLSSRAERGICSTGARSRGGRSRRFPSVPPYRPTALPPYRPTALPPYRLTALHAVSRVWMPRPVQQVADPVGVSPDQPVVASDGFEHHLDVAAMVRTELVVPTMPGEQLRDGLNQLLLPEGLGQERAG